jgi:hypothetical protein
MLGVVELEVTRDEVWVAMVTKCVVDILTASGVGSEGQVDMREMSGASVSVKEEGEEISDVNTVTALVKELMPVAWDVPVDKALEVGNAVSKVDNEAVCVKSVVTGCVLEVDTEDKAAVAGDVPILMLTGVTEGGVVAVLDVSEVGQEVQVGVTEVSGASVCVVVVGEVIADVSCPTVLLGKPGELTWDTAADVAWVVGRSVVEVDKGVVSIMPVVTDCVSGAGVEGRMVLVDDVITLGLMGEGMLERSESHVSVGATEEGVRGAMVISVRGDPVGRSVVGFSVVSPVTVVAWLGKGAWPVPVTAEIEGGGSADVGTVGVVRVVGVWVDSAVVWTVWVVVGAEGTLSICVVPELSGRMDGENAVVSGTFALRILVSPALLVLKSVGSTLETEGWVLRSVVPVVFVVE